MIFDDFEKEKFTIVDNLGRGAFTYDVKRFRGIFDLSTYPNQII